MLTRAVSESEWLWRKATDSEHEGRNRAKCLMGNELDQGGNLSCKKGFPPRTPPSQELSHGAAAFEQGANAAAQCRSS